MEWHEEPSPESQNNPEPEKAESNLEAFPVSFPEAAHIDQPPVTEVPPVEEERVEPDSEVEAFPVSFPEVALPVEEKHVEPASELEAFPVSFPEVVLPVEEPESPQLVRLPTEVPDMPAAEPPEYPIPGEDESTQPVAMPRYSPIEERIRALTVAIADYPDAAVNYVLRGELILELGERQMAQADFRRGLMLAESSADTADWGYISRALADRARAGLRRCG